MKTTLKEKYEARQVNELKKRLTRINENVLADNRHDQLILEAFDKLQMTAAVDIMKKLRATDFGNLEQLNKAKGVALADVQKALGGEGKSVVKSIINLFKKKENKLENNPLITALAFVDGVKNFFEEFIQYVEALPDVSDEKTLSHIITGQEDADALKAANADGDVKKKLRTLEKVILNGLRPNDELSKMGRRWVDDYLGGGAGMKQLAKEITQSNVGLLKKISNIVANNFKNVEVVGQAAVGAAQQGSVSTQQSTGTQQSGRTEPSSVTASTKPGTTAPGAQIPGADKNDQEKIKKMAEKLGPIIAAVKNNKFNLNLLAKKLVAAGLDPDKLM